MFARFGARRRRLWFGFLAGLVTFVALSTLTLRDRPRAGRPAPPVPQATASMPRIQLRPSEPDPPVASSTVPLALPALVRTDDPAVYARAVPTALFNVDVHTVTRAAFLDLWRHETPTVVYADAAAKGLTLTAQDHDVIDNLTTWWIPSTAVWSSEATDDTVQQLRITSITTPDYWANAVADGTFRDPGLRMQRVMGVLSQQYGADPRHRHTATRAIVIDLGLLCGPTQSGGCRLVAPQQPPDTGDS